MVRSSGRGTESSVCGVLEIVFGIVLAAWRED